MKRMIFTFFVLSQAFSSFSQVNKGWKTVHVAGGTFQMPDSCKLIVLDTSYLEKTWHLAIGKDTLVVKSWDYSPMYGNDLVLVKKYKEPLIYPTPYFERMPDFNYPSDSATMANYKKDSASVTDSNKKMEEETQKLISDLQKDLNDEIRTRELNSYLHLKLDEYISFYETQKRASSSSTTFGNISASLEGTYLTISNDRIIDLEKKDAQKVEEQRTTSIIISGGITQKKTMDVVVEILKTMQLNQ